jgi:hypothetical protein
MRGSSSFLNLLFLFTVQVGLAQQKNIQAADIWPELQAEYVFKSTSFLYFRNQYRFNTSPDFKGMGQHFPGDQLRRFQVRAGYEHVLTNQWGIGGSQMFGIEPTRKLLFTDVYVRHVNSFAEVQFTKRLMVDFLYYSNSSTQVGRLRPRLDLDKALKVNSWTFRPRVGYELFMNTDFRPETHTSPRRVDRTRLRLELGLQFSPHLTIAPYFTKQTDYTKTEDVIDEHTGMIVKGSKRNLILPIWGLDVRYILFQGKVPFPRVLTPVRED